MPRRCVREHLLSCLLSCGFSAHLAAKNTEKVAAVEPTAVEEVAVVKAQQHATVAATATEEAL